MNTHNQSKKCCEKEICTCPVKPKNIKNKISTESAVLISGVMISLAILGHGYLARGVKQTSGLTIDKAVVAQIMQKDVSNRYFGDTPTKNEEVVFTEYSDTECPFCKNFHSTIEGIVAEGKGKYAWVYKHFPLSFHPAAQKEAEAIECVRSISGDQTAFRYMDLMYAITPSNNKLPKESLFEMADAMKISSKKLRICLDENKFAEKVKADLQAGVDSGVEGTPFTFVTKNVNGESVKIGVINGAQPREMIEALLFNK